MLEAFRELEAGLTELEEGMAAGTGPATDEQVAGSLTRLLAASPVAGVDPGLLLAELLANPPAWPDQSWENLFGNASITVVRTRSIRVDVLYWLQNSSTLHKHVSPGAFLALSGRRLHVEYDFTGAELHTGVTSGQLTNVGRGMMRDASVSPITPTMVHELFWIEKPSVTVSIRCDPELTGTVDHRPHEFISPGFGYLPAAFQQTSNIQRWLDGLRILRMANRGLYVESVAAALRVVEPIYLLHVLEELCDNPPGEVEALLAKADAERGDGVLAELAPSVPQFRRRKLLSRVRAGGTDELLLAALLWSGAEGAELATLLKAEGIGEPWSFVTESGERLVSADPRIEPYVNGAKESLR